MSRLESKRKNQAEVSYGIRGCIRERLLEEMIDAVPGKFKILICDQQAMETLNLTIRMRELMSHGLTLVEDIHMNRQPIPSSPAIYFIMPTEASVQRIISDWSSGSKYKEAHIFFTSSGTTPLINLLAASPAVRSVKTLKDMLLDFAVPDPLSFHFNVRDDMSRLYGSLSTQPAPAGKDGFLSDMAERLSYVFHALGSVPIVRYQRSSVVGTSFATAFGAAMTKLAAEIPGISGADAGKVNRKPMPVLIIVDRGYDCVVPLLHERTYQCLLTDLMPIKDNIYEQAYKDRTGKDALRYCPLDELDPYWCQYRHRFFAACLVEFPAQLKELLDANPALSRGLEKGTKLSELGSAVRALPEFQEKQTKLSVHIDICEKLMAIYQRKKLTEMCELEQDVAVERRAFKEIFEVVKKLARDVSVPQDVKLRLLLLMAAASNTRDFTEGKKQQLIQEFNFSGEATKFTNLEFIISRIGQLRQTAEKQTSPSSKQRVAETPPAEGDPFKSQARLILEAVAADSLSSADFPYLNDSDAAASASTTNAPKEGRSLRAGGATRFARTAQDRALVSAGGALDLGYEGTISLTSGQRIVLFVLGGVTFGERRAAYEVSKALGREVIVGGSSELTPEGFVSQLTTLR